MVKYNKRYKYRDLCKALDLKPLSGSAQRKQLADLNKEYEMVKDKANNYIIKRKYSQVESIENQAYHKNKAYIEPMIYTVLSSATNNVVEFDMRQLLEILALVNENFFVAKYSIENSDKVITNNEANGLLLFMKETEPMLRRIVKDVLGEMADMGLIDVQERPKFAKKYRGDNGQYYTKTYVIDDENDFPVFLEAKRLALKQVGVERYSDLNFYQHSEVKHLIENYLKENLGVDYYYYSYRLILNKKGINSLIAEKYREFQVSFNQYIQNKIRESKRKQLLEIEESNKDKYIDALININTTLVLKDKLASKGGVEIE